MARKTPARAATPRWKRDPEARRLRIVEVASGLFAERGYAGTSTALIARDAGVSEGTLFHHFPSKRAILNRVGEREGDRVLAAAFADVDLAGPPPELGALLRRLFRYARENPAAYRLFVLDGEVEDLADGFSAKRARVVSGVAAALAGWSARGHLRRMDPDIVADLLFALVDTAARRLILEERWSQEESWVAELTRALQGILFEPRTHPESAPTEDAP
ncbi:MAG: TetR/AcrR family transcriptional regulator [Myxococcota bacterium]|nr:TetR/AcrR family transcriptional regulator [Myxococcota bacterium]